MKELILKRITVIIIGLISITELISTKDLSYSVLLWFLYGIYKIYFNND